jgi:tetratricopeptide (TPR) repeat protein
MMKLIFLGIWLALAGQVQESDEDQALKTKTHLAFGHKHLRNGKYQLALNEYSEILKAEPNHFDANLGRARSLIGLGDSAKAAGPARLATDLRPDSAEAFGVLGDAYSHANTQDYPRASQAYQKALALKPDSLGAAMSLARALSYQKEVEQAIQVLENARKHHPGNTELLTKLAESYYAIRKLDKAEGLIGVVLEKDPENAQANKVLDQIRGRQAYNLWIPIIALVAFPLIILFVRWMKKGRIPKA